MYKEVWKKCSPSICSISFFNNSGGKIGSGTGFKVKNKLVTNNHVYAVQGASVVELKFKGPDGHSDVAQKKFAYAEFQALILEGMSENGWDYAILKLEDVEFRDVPSLELENGNQLAIGHPIAVLGFPFEGDNLSMSQGIISSRFIRGDVKYIQLDANVNQGNSGGPLIDAETGRIVGVITRKATGLSKAFDELLKSFENNAQALEAASRNGGFVLGGINLGQAIAVTQRQLKLTGIEIRRSANVGIGYAYELDKILDYFNH